MARLAKRLGLHAGQGECEAVICASCLWVCKMVGAVLGESMHAVRHVLLDMMSPTQGGLAENTVDWFSVTRNDQPSTYTSP